MPCTSPAEGPVTTHNDVHLSISDDSGNFEASVGSSSAAPPRVNTTEEARTYQAFMGKTKALLDEYKSVHAAVTRFMSTKRLLAEQYLRFGDAVASCASRADRGQPLLEVTDAFTADVRRVVSGSEEWRRYDEAVEKKVLEPLQRVHKAGGDMLSATGIFAAYVASGKRRSTVPNGGKHYAQCKRYHDQYLRRADKHLENIIYGAGMYMVAVLGDLMQIWEAAHAASAERGITEDGAHSQGVTPLGSPLNSITALQSVPHQPSTSLTAIPRASAELTDSASAALAALREISTATDMLADTAAEVFFALLQAVKLTQELAAFPYSAPAANFRDTIAYATKASNTSASANSSVKRSVYEARYHDQVEKPLRAARGKMGRLQLLRSAVSTIVEEKMTPLRRPSGIHSSETPIGGVPSRGASRHSSMADSDFLETPRSKNGGGGGLTRELQGAWVNMCDIAVRYLGDLQRIISSAVNE